MNVLQVIAPAMVGGAETVVLGLAEGLVAAGHRSPIAAMVPDESHPFILAARRRGLEVHPVIAGRRRYDQQVRAVAHLLREGDAQVLHSHGYHADVIGHWGARAAGRPNIATLHGFTGTGAKDRLYDRIVAFHHRRADAVVAVSLPIAQRLPTRGVLAGRVRLIPNGRRAADRSIDRAAACTTLGLAPTGTHLVWAGRFSEEKGADVMLEAFAELSRGRATLSMIGEGPQRNSLQEQAQRLGIADAVVWHGLVPEAHRLFGAMDVLVLSSRTEGTPMVLLEAMAATLPIVATRVGGVPDMLTDDEAVLVAPDPDLLAAALERVLDDPEAAKVRAGAALKRFERDFSEATWIARHEEMYRAVTRK